MYWDQSTETMERSALEALQLERLKKTVDAAAQSEFYRDRFASINCDPADISSLDDIRRIPFTTKDDLRESWPYGCVAVPKDPGRATVIFHTAHDLDAWTDILARAMYMTGMRESDVFQNMMTYGLFTGGLGIHYGAERLGCLTIPAGAGNSKRQIKLLQDFQVSVIHIIPSYALHLATVFESMGLDPHQLALKIALIGAEPHSEEIRRRIEALYGIKAYNSYGLSEMNGPGVAFECPEQNGMHLWEDAFLPEIIDPVTLQPVAEGEVGELVLTTLTREGMPILRYRTRDLTRFLPGDCPCGRAHRRIDRILGRSDDMIIIKGVNIFPMQVERVLMGIPEVGQNYLIVLERKGFLDQFKVLVEVKSEFFVEDMRVLKQLQARITSLLRDELLVTPKVELVEASSLPCSEGKAQRVQDLRE